MIASIFMIIDHIHSYLAIGPEWISLLPRFVAPLFVYFLVEGFYHTKNWKKYFQRIFTFAIIMLLGNIFINYIFHSVNYVTGKMDLYSLQQGNNIFLTLSVYLLILNLLQLVKSNNGIKKYSLIFLIVILCVLSLPFCEGSMYLLPLLFIFNFGYGNKKYLILV
ncbi:TraX family protein [Anaerofustis butyriciformans]|uniref:TraX family protein n=1 Tax=Anaerofustis butyriciformans TaxID=3108533 RepID=UPI003F8C16C4